jgi:hypothetical protein
MRGSETVVDEHETVAGSMRDALRRALAADPGRVRRLQQARTSVCFRVAGSDAQVTVLLDRDQAALDLGAGPAEIEIELDIEQVKQFVAGEFPLPPAVVSGAVAVRGPVRKYLQFDAILRGLLAETSSDDARPA